MFPSPNTIYIVLAALGALVLALLVIDRRVHRRKMREARLARLARARQGTSYRLPVGAKLIDEPPPLQQAAERRANLAPIPDAISKEEADRVLAEAERAAVNSALGDLEADRNPHPPNSRAHVLWETHFGLTFMDWTGQQRTRRAQRRAGASHARGERPRQAA